MIISDILERAEVLGLGNYMEQLRTSAIKAVLFRTKPVSSLELLPIGNSRLGGTPDIPEDFTWPLWLNRPLDFIAQINLAAVAQIGGIPSLPKSGSFLFFYDSAQQAWGSDPHERGSCKVCFIEPQTSLGRAGDFSDAKEEKYTACALSCELLWTLPSPFSKEVSHFGFNEPETEIYCRLFEEVMRSPDRSTQTYMFGHPDIIQGDMSGDLSLVAKSLQKGSVSGHTKAHRRRDNDKGKEWNLLLQVSSENDAKMEWGDQGCLYFWVPDNEQGTPDVSAAWAILQSH